VTGEESGVWKWLAAFLAGAMLAGAPSYAILVSKPSNAKVETLEANVRDLQIQQARFSEQILVLQQQIHELLTEGKR